MGAVRAITMIAAPAWVSPSCLRPGAKEIGIAAEKRRTENLSFFIYVMFEFFLY